MVGVRLTSAEIDQRGYWRGTEGSLARTVSPVMSARLLRRRVDRWVENVSPVS